MAETEYRVVECVADPGLDVVILAAGNGTRLGRAHPKPLTVLSDQRSILIRQLDQIERAFGRLRPCVVVGFGADAVIHAVGSRATFVHNAHYRETNTAKSLEKAVEVSGSGGLLWMNGDVVFGSGLLDFLVPYVARSQCFVCVNQGSVGEEEVKYSLDPDGYVAELSKEVAEGLGEAIGINFVCSNHRPLLLEDLGRCEAHDYFERAIEMAIGRGVRFRALDILDFPCVEVDFVEDLARANSIVGLECAKR